MSGNEVDYLYVAEMIGSWTIMAGLAAGYVNLIAVVAIVTLPLLIASLGTKAAHSLTAIPPEASPGLLSLRNIRNCPVHCFDRMTLLFAFPRSSKDSVSSQL